MCTPGNQTCFKFGGSGSLARCILISMSMTFSHAFCSFSSSSFLCCSSALTFFIGCPLSLRTTWTTGVLRCRALKSLYAWSLSSVEGTVASSSCGLVVSGPSCQSVGVKGLRCSSRAMAWKALRMSECAGVPQEYDQYRSCVLYWVTFWMVNLHGDSSTL